jgi:hypothetical protein
MDKNKFRVPGTYYFDDPYMPGNVFSITPTLLWPNPDKPERIATKAQRHKE